MTSYQALPSQRSQEGIYNPKEDQLRNGASGSQLSIPRVSEMASHALSSGIPFERAFPITDQQYQSIVGYFVPTTSGFQQHANNLHSSRLGNAQAGRKSQFQSLNSSLEMLHPPQSIQRAAQPLNHFRRSVQMQQHLRTRTTLDTPEKVQRTSGSLERDEQFCQQFYRHDNGAPQEYLILDERAGASSGEQNLKNRRHGELSSQKEKLVRRAQQISTRTRAKEQQVSRSINKIQNMERVMKQHDRNMKKGLSALHKTKA